jgi:transposase
MLITPAQTTAERVDDLPLVLHWLKQMEVATILDKWLMPAHQNRSGLSYGQLAVLFLAYVVSQADHRLNHVEGWVRDHQRTLELTTGWEIRDKDASDDRLADLLSRIGSSEAIDPMEEALGRQVVTAYALPTEVARCDSTSFSVYHKASGEGEAETLIHYGYSKDRRPDLQQYRHALATLDPAGVPLVSATLPGNGDDDSIYYPFWQGLVSAIGHRNFVYIADAKAASLANRAKLSQAGGIYCFPLPLSGHMPERLQQWVLSPPAQLQSLHWAGQSVADEPLCVGFELSLGSLWQVPQTERFYTWHERYLVVCSEALAARQREGLQQRLEKTQQALDKLASKPASDGCTLKHQVQAILQRHRTQDYFTIEISTQSLTRYSTPGRPSTKQPKPHQTIEQFCLQVQQQPAAIEQARRLCGWRVYVSNAPVERLSLAEAVGYYRQQWQLEHGFHRFKRGNLPAVPIYLQDSTRIVGLMFLLTIALRVFTLMEFVVQQQVQSLQQPLAGLYAGNPKRVTARPSAEHLLKAFNGITLYFLRDGTVEITPLNALQQKILALMQVPLSIYHLDPLSG